MQITWDVLVDDFSCQYAEISGKEVGSKANKMLTTRFKSIKPLFKNVDDFIHCDEQILMKKTRNIGKVMAEVMLKVRTKFCDLQCAEKDQKEKDDRFEAYRKKCDENLKAQEEALKAKYNPKFSAEFLSLFVIGCEASGVKMKDIEVDMDLLEKFRQAITIKKS